MASVTLQGMTMHVKWDSLKAPSITDAGIQEIKILPDPTQLNLPATVIQQAGRKRRTISWDGYVTSWGDWSTLYGYFQNGTQVSYVGPGGTFNVYIKELSEPVYIFDNYITYTIKLIEA